MDSNVIYLFIDSFIVSNDSFPIQPFQGILVNPMMPVARSGTVMSPSFSAVSQIRAGLRFINIFWFGNGFTVINIVCRTWEMEILVIAGVQLDLIRALIGCFLVM